MSEKNVDAQLFVMRFEGLKRQWFSADSSAQFDEDGQELPSLIDRTALARMFENMNLEIPVMPDEPPVPRGHRGKHIGIWWKK